MDIQYNQTIGGSKMVEVIQSFRCSLCGQEFKPYSRGNKTALKEAKEKAKKCEKSHAVSDDLSLANIDKTSDFDNQHNHDTNKVDYNMDVEQDELSHFPKLIRVNSKRYDQLQAYYKLCYIRCLEDSEFEEGDHTILD